MSTVATPPAVSAASDLTPVGRRLAGKTAVITGGTTGLGFATAQRFLAEGARVLVTGQDAGRVAEAAAALGPGAVALRADVRAVADLDAFAARAREVFGAPGDGPTSDANGGADAERTAERSTERAASTWCSPTPAWAASRRSSTRTRRTSTSSSPST
jgi:NAD(P)-dependent dehydrogenase (short-subunit alcohol dehydrogenase family)